MDHSTLRQIVDGAPCVKAPPSFDGSEPLPDFLDWTARRYSGPIPERQFLVSDILPLGVPALLAAEGGIGKSMLGLQLAAMVATYDLRLERQLPLDVLGGTVKDGGTAVILTAEDDRTEVHRRLAALDPDSLCQVSPHRLIVVPLCEVGGAFAIAQVDHGRPAITEKAKELAESLHRLDNLKLIIFDPLQAFNSGDTKSSEVCQCFCSYMSKLANSTGATVLAMHHFRKDRDIRTPQGARDAVRGSGGLVDGVRIAYALWRTPAEEAKHVRNRVDDPSSAEGDIVSGAVIKANWPADYSVCHYHRQSTGLLEACPGRVTKQRLLQMLEDAIADAAGSKPFKKTGKDGVYDKRARLPAALAGLARKCLFDMVDQLLLAGRVVSIKSAPANLRGALDIPTGPLASANNQH